MYKVLWEQRVGETFIVVHETGNEHDRHAMAVYRDEEPRIVCIHCQCTCHFSHERSAEVLKLIRIFSPKLEGFIPFWHRGAKKLEVPNFEKKYGTMNYTTVQIRQ